MKIYEILTSYMSVEVHHVKANNEDEALKQFHDGESRHIKTYDDEYDDLVQAGEDGPWKLADYTKQYGEFE